MKCPMLHSSDNRPKTTWLPNRQPTRNRQSTWKQKDRTAGCAATELERSYVGVLVVPEEEGEREERQIVVCPLEAGETG